MRALQLCENRRTRILAVADAVAGAMRPERATILRPSRVSDDAGGFNETYDVAHTNIPARVTPQGMQPWEKVDKIGDRIISVNVFLIAMPAGTDIQPTDRIRIDTFDELPQYEVTGTNGPASFEVERVAQAIRVYG